MSGFVSMWLPFILLAACLAVIFISQKITGDTEKSSNYLLLGMGIGIAVGAVIAVCLKLQVSLCVTGCMLVGEIIGCFIKKKDRK